MPLGLFLFFNGGTYLYPDFTTPSGRGLVIPGFFHYYYPAVRTGSSNIRCFFCFFFLRGQLRQNSARSKQYLAVNFVRLAFIRQNFHENYTSDWMAWKYPSMRSKNEDANELWSWHEFAKPALARKHYITETQKLIRGSPLPFDQVEKFNSEMQAYFWQFWFTSPKYLEKVSVEKKQGIQMDLTSTWMRAWTKVLASFESQHIRAGIHLHFVAR